MQFFREKKYLFKIFQIHHLHVYFDIIPISWYTRGVQKYCKFIFISHQVHKPGKEPQGVDKRNIDHIYIYCWFAVYRWSEIEKKNR